MKCNWRWSECQNEALYRCHMANDATEIRGTLCGKHYTALQLMMKPTFSNVAGLKPIFIGDLQRAMKEQKPCPTL